MSMMVGTWGAVDLSSMLMPLGIGPALSTTPIRSGATFRTNASMGGFDGSCQYWKQGRLNWVDSGLNPYLVGVGEALWNGSRSCGQCLSVTYPKTKREVVMMITDYCPPPCTRHQLDMHASGTSFLASGLSHHPVPYRGGPENLMPLLVKPVVCYWNNEPLQYYWDRGSSRFHWYLIVFGSQEPIEVMRADRWDLGRNQVIPVRKKISHDLYGRWVVEWYGEAVEGHYRVQFRGQRGTWITDIFKWAPTTRYVQRPIQSNVQFKVARNQARYIANWPRVSKRRPRS